LFRQWRLRRSIELQPQRFDHGPVVHDFCPFLVLFCRPVRGHLSDKERIRRPPPNRTDHGV
jgi:hypothetical protein